MVQARILVNKQDELRELEYHLDHIDSARTAPTRLRSRESDGNVRRVQLLAHIEHKFKEYGQSSPIVLYVQTLIDSIADLLTIAKTLSGFNKPPERDWLSVKTYFDFEERVCNTESHYFAEKIS